MRTSIHLAIGLVLLSPVALGQSQQQSDVFRETAEGEREATGFVRLRVANAAGNLSDEALVIFHTGSPATDGEDVLKYSFSHPTAPRIATTSDGTVLLAINAYGPYTTEVSIPVMLKVATNGSYSLTLTGLEGVGLTCLTLEDPVAAITTPLQEGTTYTFNALANAPPDQPRFILHGSAPIPMELRAPNCSGAADGLAEVDLGDANANVIWSTASGDELASIEAPAGGFVNGPEMPAGEYEVRIEGPTACGVLRAAFELIEPDPIQVDIEVQVPLCYGYEGVASVTILGGTEPYQIAWSNGQSESILDIQAGSYTVDVTDGNGCIHPSVPVEVEEGNTLEAILQVDEQNILNGDPVLVSSGSDPELDHLWDFGDGTTSTELAPEHTYAIPGIYQLSLTVRDGECASTTTVTITVESTTGMAERTNTATKAWYSHGAILVDHSFSNAVPVEVRVLNATGQLVFEARYPAVPARITVTNTPLTTGVWFVQVGNGTTLSTFRVPVGM